MLQHTTMTRKGYVRRVMDDRLELYLRTFGAVCIEGPKASGKTWTSLNHANSLYSIEDKKDGFVNRRIVSDNPDAALIGETPHLIDEWQDAPAIWDAVRSAVDEDTEKGRFILTGSSTPVTKGVMHSGIGRIGTMRIHTMTLFETGDSDGSVSLKDLFDSPVKSVVCRSLDIDGMIRIIIRGGWPGNSGFDIEQSMLFCSDYLEKAIVDASTLDGKQRSIAKMRLLIRSLARNESTLAKRKTLMRDIDDWIGTGTSINDSTVIDYLDALERIFLVMDIPAYSPKLRSSIRVGKAAKRHLCDPSLAVAALGAGQEMLRDDRETLGFLFESLCLHDLMAYSEANGWKLFHYHDGYGNEADAIVEASDGRWGAFEVKLGATDVGRGAENLLKLNRIFTEDGLKPASVLCVICGSAEHAYTRPDGVTVLPITALRE